MRPPAPPATAPPRRREHPRPGAGPRLPASRAGTWPAPREQPAPPPGAGRPGSGGGCAAGRRRRRIRDPPLRAGTRPSGGGPRPPAMTAGPPPAAPRRPATGPRPEPGTGRGCGHSARTGLREGRRPDRWPMPGARPAGLLRPRRAAGPRRRRRPRRPARPGGPRWRGAAPPACAPIPPPARRRTPPTGPSGLPARRVSAVREPSSGRGVHRSPGPGPRRPAAAAPTRRR